MPQQITRNAYSDASQLLEALSPTRTSQWETGNSSWLFRGQANSEWDLIPTAARDSVKAFAKYGIQEPSTAKTDWGLRVDNLNAMLVQFRDRLDQAGIPIPTPSPLISHQEPWPPKTLSMTHPEISAFPLMALAQHHGLPTLLLDWTFHAWTATYFAAKTAIVEEPAVASLAVWAIPYEDWELEKGQKLLYSAPGGSNPNLCAQSGLFTLHLDERSRGLNLWSDKVKLRGNNTTSLPIRKLELPGTEAPKLLKLLAEYGVHGASLFPGTNGVVERMKERALYP